MFFKSDDAQLWYDVRGPAQRDAPTVVFLHPFPADHHIWLPVAEALAPRYRCVIPDLRGHGDSETGNGPATMQKHATDLARLCEVLQLGQAVFAGISIGGYILFEFWRRQRERIRALILADTRATPDSDGGRKKRFDSIREVNDVGPADFLDRMSQTLLGATTRRNRPDVVTAARQAMRMSVSGITAVQAGMAERPDSTPTLHHISEPTLILVGEEDLTTPPSDAAFLQREIPGSRLETIARAGHYSVFEQPEAASRLIRAFLETLRA